jgi:hypothetical protein
VLLAIQIYVFTAFADVPWALDAQVLLDPLEEQLHLSAQAVNVQLRPVLQSTTDE